MNIKFEVKTPEVGYTKAIVYDVTGEKAIVAGTVRLVEYNGGTLVRPEPHDINGEKIGTGSTDFNDHIETVKSSYLSRLQREQSIEDSWTVSEELADELGVSKELYIKHANVRVYIHNIRCEKVLLDKSLTSLTQLISFRDSVGFKSNLPAVKETIVNKIDELKKAVDSSEKEIENHTKWIGEYSL